MGNIGTRLAGFFSLDQNINKVKDVDRELQEGVISDFEPALKLEMSDEELIKLSRQWNDTWEKYYKTKLKPRQDRSESYWMGRPRDLKDELILVQDKPSSDNLIFEALETFLPQATQRNPEPTTIADNTEEGFMLSDKVNKMLVFQADRLRLKLKGKKATRHWALYFLAVAKIGFSGRTNDIDTKIIRPQKMILDPEAEIDDDGNYTGEYIGERREDTAENLAQRFPSKKEFIKRIAKGKMGTTIGYIEWWTDQALFWTLKDKVLDKVKNPHWNYDEEDTIEVKVVDEFGEISTEIQDRAVPGDNHFEYPKKPYVFLSVFNIGTRPHDNTSLIEQNIPQQDTINKRERQIDENVDNMNGGWVVSLQNAGMTKEQAGGIARVLQKGGVAAIPSGAPRSAIERIVGSGLPADVFNDKQDARNELRGIFGITGLTPQGTQQESTVRGKIITKGQDSTRIGGGVTEYLEQWYDSIFNWWVQMFYVYYDEAKSIPVLGADGGREWIELSNNELDKRLTVSVKEGSLIPKDELTRRNEAIDLWTSGALDPLNLFKALDHPNPREAVENLIKWKSDPLSLLGEGDQFAQANGSAPPGTEEAAILGEVPIQ